LMMIAITQLTADEAFAEIELRGISLTGWPGLRLWLASVERVKSKKRFTKANMEIVSAIAATPLAAIDALLAKLDATPQETALFEEVEPW
jgi:hypothetical protein